MTNSRSLIAPIAVIWALAAAGMAAALAPSGEASARLDDIQIGERGLQTRIALICEGDCALEKRGDTEFLLHNVGAALNLDLSDRSERVAGLKSVKRGGASAISLAIRGAVDHVNTKTCSVGGRQAACIDLFFAEASDAEPEAETETQNIAQSESSATVEEAVAVTAGETPLIIAAAAPSLRETAPERLTVYARLAPPERLTPPQGAILAKVQPIEETAPVEPSPKIAADTDRPFDFAERVRAILGKELTSDYCAESSETLQGDPWALGAMVDVGLCAAARGDVEEAEEILARLIEYTPDNYEAHVGRALLAVQAGETMIARRHYQSALNALPPIAESNRIVQAMAAL